MVQTAQPGSKTAGGNPHPYVPATDSDREAMLKAIGVTSFEDLIQDIPAKHRHPEFNIPDGVPDDAAAMT